MLNKKFFALWSLLLCTSCLTAPANNYYKEQDIFQYATETFIKIETHLVVGICAKGVCTTAHSEL